MTMDILKGLLLINGVDVFVDYGAFLAEEKAGDTKNYSALLKPPSAKPHTAVSFREKDCNAGAGRFGMTSACALAMFSGKIF